MSRAAQLATSAGVLAAGLGLGVGARNIPSDAGYAGVGPNFLPWVVAGLLAVCGLVLLAHALGAGWRELDEPEGAARGDWPAFAWVSAGILANAALITTIGFVLSCALCFLLAARGFRWAEGARAWNPGSLVKDGLVGMAIAAPVYWMFTKGLAINLPGLTGSGWL